MSAKTPNEHSDLGRGDGIVEGVDVEAGREGRIANQRPHDRYSTSVGDVNHSD